MLSIKNEIHCRKTWNTRLSYTIYRLILLNAFTILQYIIIYDGSIFNWCWKTRLHGLIWSYLIGNKIGGLCSIGVESLKRFIINEIHFRVGLRVGFSQTQSTFWRWCPVRLQPQRLVLFKAATYDTKLVLKPLWPTLSSVWYLASEQAAGRPTALGPSSFLSPFEVSGNN